MEATITSFSIVPAGLLMVRERTAEAAPLDAAARKAELHVIPFGSDEWAESPLVCAEGIRAVSSSTRAVGAAAL